MRCTTLSSTPPLQSSYEAPPAWASQGHPTRPKLRPGPQATPRPTRRWHTTLPGLLYGSVYGSYEASSGVFRALWGLEASQSDSWEEAPEPNGGETCEEAAARLSARTNLGPPPELRIVSIGPRSTCGFLRLPRSL